MVDVLPKDLTQTITELSDDDIMTASDTSDGGKDKRFALSTLKNYTSGTVLRYATFVALYAADPPTQDGTQCLVAGRLFVWNADSTKVDDDAITVALPTGHVGAGRWEALSMWHYLPQPTQAELEAVIADGLRATYWGPWIQLGPATIDVSSTIEIDSRWDFRLRGIADLTKFQSTIPYGNVFTGVTTLVKVDTDTITFDTPGSWADGTYNVFFYDTVEQENYYRYDCVCTESGGTVTCDGGTGSAYTDNMLNTTLSLTEQTSVIKMTGMLKCYFEHFIIRGTADIGIHVYQSSPSSFPTLSDCFFNHLNTTGDAIGIPGTTEGIFLDNRRNDQNSEFHHFDHCTQSRHEKALHIHGQNVHRIQITNHVFSTNDIGVYCDHGVYFNLVDSQGTNNDLDVYVNFSFVQLHIENWRSEGSKRFLVSGGHFVALPTTLKNIRWSGEPGGDDIMIDGDFEDWTAGDPDNWTIDVGTKAVDVVEESARKRLNFRALKFVGDGSTLTKISQELTSLVGRVQYFPYLYIYFDETLSQGVLQVDLWDGSAIVEDAGGRENKLIIDLPTITGGGVPFWTRNPGFFFTDLPAPDPIYLRIHFTTPMASGKSIYLDTCDCRRNVSVIDMATNGPLSLENVSFYSLNGNPLNYAFFDQDPGTLNISGMITQYANNPNDDYVQAPIAFPKNTNFESAGGLPQYEDAMESRIWGTPIMINNGETTVDMWHNESQRNVERGRTHIGTLNSDSGRYDLSQEEFSGASDDSTEAWPFAESGWYSPRSFTAAFDFRYVSALTGGSIAKFSGIRLHIAGGGTNFSLYDLNDNLICNAGSARTESLEVGQWYRIVIGWDRDAYGGAALSGKGWIGVYEPRDGVAIFLGDGNPGVPVPKPTTAAEIQLGSVDGGNVDVGIRNLSMWDRCLDPVEMHQEARNRQILRREKNETTGYTASTTQTQGKGQLNGRINEVTVCATTNDTCTLPPLNEFMGETITVINNGAETLQLFPYPEDNLGQGVNTATTIVAAAYKRFAVLRTNLAMDVT